MIHFTDRLAIGEMLKCKNLDTPISAIDYLVKEGIISETKLIDYAQNFIEDLLPYNYVVLLINSFEKICPKPISTFDSNYNFIRFLEAKGIIDEDAIEYYCENLNKEFTKERDTQ